MWSGFHAKDPAVTLADGRHSDQHRQTGHHHVGGELQNPSVLDQDQGPRLPVP